MEYGVLNCLLLELEQEQMLRQWLGQSIFEAEPGTGNEAAWKQVSLVARNKSSCEDNLFLGLEIQQEHVYKMKQEFVR